MLYKTTACTSAQMSSVGNALWPVRRLLMASQHSSATSSVAVSRLQGSKYVRLRGVYSTPRILFSSEVSP